MIQDLYSQWLLCTQKTIFKCVGIKDFWSTNIINMSQEAASVHGDLDQREGKANLRFYQCWILHHKLILRIFGMLKSLEHKKL